MKLDRARYDPGELLNFTNKVFPRSARFANALGTTASKSWLKAAPPSSGIRTEPCTKSNCDLRPPMPSPRRRGPRSVSRLSADVPTAEALRDAPLPLERFVLPDAARSSAPPDTAVAEKLWRAQFPDTRRWQLAAPFQPDFHFSLVAPVRCEIQAIDQHWSLHRVAVSLPGGELDDNLAREISFQQAGSQAVAEIAWLAPEPAAWSGLLQRALERELAEELARVRARQEGSLRRELERIDDYFENYEHELSARAGRSSSENSKLKAADRLAAAKGEHTRRRADQLARHEIRVHLHVDALLLVAEGAWRAQLHMESAQRAQTIEARFVPRSRRWIFGDQKD